MSTINSSLSVSSLDYSSYKTSLKTFLKSQAQFKDYNFEDSNIDVLLSVLSYNSSKNAFYNNMVMSEAFLDSAQIKSSVVSRAKDLNYLPTSFKSSKAIVDLIINTTNTALPFFFVPKGTTFSGFNDKTQYTFVTDIDYNLKNLGSGKFEAPALSIYEGIYTNESYVVNSLINNQRFILSNANVDLNSLTVTVTIDNNTTVFNKATNLYGLTPLSKVFFIQSFDEKYEIVFGDGVTGIKPPNNSLIILNYRVCEGDSADNTTNFSLGTDLSSVNLTTYTTSIVTVSKSYGGAIQEDIESIRFRAPRHYQTQDSAINSSDYSDVVLENFPDVKDIFVYGGEQVLSAPSYGTIFISCVSQNGSVLPDYRKKDIVSFLNDKKALGGFNIVLVDPSFIFVNLSLNFATDNSISNSVLQTSIINSISTFNGLYLNSYNSVFRSSKLVSYLSLIDNSILGVDLNITITKKINILLNVKNPFVVNFNNKIIPGTVTSDNFWLDDGSTYSFVDYNPNVNTITRTIINNLSVFTNSVNTLFLRKNTQTKLSYIPIGKIDYNNGIINVSPVAITQLTNGNYINITATPIVNDVYAKLNDIIEIDQVSTNVTFNT